MVPDVEGTYSPIGNYMGKPYYEIAATGWFIWWDGTDTWNISTVVGTQGTAYWTHAFPGIEGAYTIGGTATGEATVAVVN